MIDALVALPFALLPRRRWDLFDLPIQNVVLASSLLTCLGGAALGITGFFAYMAYVLAQREWTAPPLMIFVFVSYLFATPRGLFSVYLTISGLLRAIGWVVGEPFGDPILTGIDSLVSRTRTSQRERTARVARERLEGTDEPDRRYDGDWAGLAGVDYVIVAARRKPGWTKGTWVITADGWFTLGEPFDRPTANGLRTVYPLTLQTTTLEVLRKGVSYELPPLRMSTARRLPETPGPSGES
jgi:hypothetical protein